MLGDGQIKGNHGHAASIPAAHLAGNADQMYSIKGGSPHDHTITITAANFATLRSGGTINVKSTSSGHTHDCTIKC